MHLDKILKRFYIFLPLIFFYIYMYFILVYQKKLDPYASPTLAINAILALKNNKFFQYAFLDSSGVTTFLTFNELGSQEHGPSFLLNIVKLAQLPLSINSELTTKTIITVILSLFLLLTFTTTFLIRDTKWIFFTPILYFIIFWFYHPLSSAGGRSLTAVSTSFYILLIFSLFSTNKSKIYFFLFVFSSLILGILPFLREDTYVVYLVAGTFLFVVFLVNTIVDIKKGSTSNFRLINLALVWLPYVFYISLKKILEYSLQRIWEEPNVKYTNHGSGHSLFLGLGYTDNPFSIAWSDFNGQIQAKILSNDPYFCGIYDNQCLSLLEREWLNLVFIDIPSFIYSIFIKLADAFTFLVFSNNFSQNQYFGITLGYNFILLLLIFLVEFLVLIYILFKNKKSGVVYVLIFNIITVISSLITPVIIFPTYLSSFLGGFSTLILINFFSILSFFQKTKFTFVKIDSISLISIFAIFLIPILLISVSSNLISSKRINFLIDSPLNEVIGELDYKTAYYFNMMGEKEKLSFLTSLDESKDTENIIWNLSETQKSSSNFVPEYAILMENRLMVIAFLGSPKFPSTSLDQGRFHGGIHVCNECAVPNAGPGFNPIDSSLIFLSDDVWSNQYYALLLPVDQTSFSELDRLTIQSLRSKRIDYNLPFGVKNKVDSINFLTRS